MMTMEPKMKASPAQNMQPSPFTSLSPDVLVIGGGPAGSAVATLLADQGHDVVMLEKAHHPRFHIGESLLPMNMPLFDRLGVRQEIEKIGITKYGAEFVSPWHDHTSEIFFADAMDKAFPYSMHVKRSELDEVLFRHAAKRGARTFEGSRVIHADMNEGPANDGRAIVKAKADDGSECEWRPRFVIDASGRDTLLSNQFGLKKRSSKHSSAALFAHFDGGQRGEGRREGNITLFWFDYGWFWYIPLPDGTVSVGVVASPTYFKTRKSDPSTFLLETVALAPRLADRLKNATMTAPATATGNYAYNSSCCRGNRFAIIGDAYAFIDPMFSSGVLLAMNSAFESAAAVDYWLRDEKKMAERAFRLFEHNMDYGSKVFSWFIYRINSPIIRRMFMYPRNIWRMKEALLTILAGDIFRSTPFRPRMIAFKLYYYCSCVANFSMVFKAWNMRRRNLNETLANADPE